MKSFERADSAVTPSEDFSVKAGQTCNRGELKRCVWALMIAVGMSSCGSTNEGDSPGTGGSPAPSSGTGGRSSGGANVPATGGSSSGGTPVISSSGGTVGTGGTTTAGTGGTSPATQSGGAPAVGSGGTPPANGNTGGSAGSPVPTVPAGPVPPTSAATRMRCTGTSPIRCDFGGAVGNYDVTVTLGGEQAGNTIVQAEQGRIMLPAVVTAAGETKTFSFTVNVRQPEGEPIQMRPSNGTPGLDVYFTGTAPQLKEIGYAPASKPLVIYIAADSTVCDQPAGLGGWGQSLPQFFNYPVSVANYADSGESSGSFFGGSLFGAIKPKLKAGDWVFVQFGHNDKQTSASAFHDNLARYVTETRAAGALPLLFSPISRASFNGNTLGPQHINGVGANLPMIVKQVADELKAPFIDLTALTTEWLNGVGPSAVQTFFGGQATHTNVAGANAIATIVRDAIRKLAIPELTAVMR